MRYLLALVVFTIGCGDDPLSPSAPVIPPPEPALIAWCEVVIPAVPAQLLCIEGEGCIVVGAPARTMLEPCD